jgi:hypothetical protein
VIPLKTSNVSPVQLGLLGADSNDCAMPRIMIEAPFRKSGSIGPFHGYLANFDHLQADILRFS